MNLTIFPAPLAGTITPPPSKSQAHRLLLAAALAQGESRIANLACSEDVQATLSCVEQLGARWAWETDGVLRLTGLRADAVRRGPDGLPQFDCGESGSTLRFLIPIALAVAGGGHFTGHGRLMERPQKPYFDLFEEKGVAWEKTGAVLTVRGSLRAGSYRLAGNVSSQFFTGLLYALPLLEGDSQLQPTTQLESRSYLDMTCEALALAGVRVEPAGAGYAVAGGQTFRPVACAVEADWSQAGFFLAAQAIGHDVTLSGLRADAKQGDRIAADYFSRLAQPGAVTLDVADCPDLVPPLAACAALRPGSRTEIVNAARLRIKESDRLATVSSVLGALGAQITEGPDSLVIEGKASLAGGVTVEAHNDHRIAMMTAIAATRCRGPVKLLGASCVAKSYPNFWEDYARLGGRILEEA